MWGDGHKSYIDSSIDHIFDFSGQGKDEFIEDVKEISEALQSKKLDKGNQYSSLKEAFLNPEKSFSRLESQGTEKFTVKDVQEYILDKADNKINEKSSELGINKSDIIWNKEKVVTTGSNKEFKSLEKQNLDNMSYSNELREQNRAEARQRSFESSFVGKVAKSVNEAAKAQGGEKVRMFQDRVRKNKGDLNNVKASSFYR